MEIREAREKDFRGMMIVAKSLSPGWFERFAIKNTIPIDLKIQRSFVAEKGNKIIGFITYFSEEGKVKISWMGVKPKFQRKSIGTKLMKKLETELKKIGIKELRLDTLAPREKYEPYDRTKAFYKKIGFKIEKVVKKKSKDTGEEFELGTYVKKL
jgi:ribosomal protein S18 acetylase RimI-like enzyme